jgi:predicted permease
MLTESLLLFFIGGIAGLVVAVAGVAALVKLAPAAMPELRSVRVDWPVALFAFALSTSTGLIFGLMPGFTALREKAHDALKQRGAAPGNSRVRHAMVVAQIALAIVLLGASGLLIRSFLNLNKLDLGFRPDHLLTFRVTLPEAKYPRRPEVTNFFNTLNDRLRTLPGVQASGGTTALLLSELPNAAGEFTVEGRADKGGLVEQPVARTLVTAGFFSSFGQPLREGREFNEQDGPASPPVAIVNESMARRYFDGRSPIGRRLTFGRPSNNSTWFTIVGVAADTRRRGLDRDIGLEAYTPMTQASRRSTTFIVRTAADPLSMVGSVRELVRSIDRDQPISAIAPMDRLLDDRMAPRRFVMLLLMLLAGSALLLAAVGLYGVLAYLVTLRTQEFGVRLALGATGSDVLSLVSTRSLILVGAGILIGIAGSLAATRLMGTMLYNVSARDPLTLAAAAVTIGIAAALATLIPALRASRVDPMVALRYE